MLKSIHLILFAALISISATCQKKEEPAKNVLFIMSDDLKPLLSNYGYPQMKTPNFDRLAEMGVTFMNAHSQQAVCGPSRASIMTATYPDRTKVWDLQTDFRQSAPELISMPEYMISKGFETTGIGKIYHKPSAAPGHDGKSWSIPHVQPDNYDPKYGTPLFESYQDPKTKAAFEEIMKEAQAKGLKGNNLRNFALEKLKPSTECVDVSDEAYQDGIYTVEAIKKLKQLNAAGKPFMLMVGYQKPHLPFIAPKKYWDLYDRNKIELAPFRGPSEGTPNVAFHNSGEMRSFTDIEDNIDVNIPIPDDKQRELIHGYMAGVSYVDAQIGKLLDALKAEGLDKNTIVVLWGDHGYHLGDHNMWNKHSNFEQATRSAFMMAGPGLPKNVKINDQVEVIDAFPTLFDLLGLESPVQVEGVSLMPLLDKDKKTVFSKDYALSQFHRGPNGKIMGYSIRTVRYRYTEWHDNNYKTYQPYKKENIVGVELYDYQTDPNETKNLIKDPGYKDVLANLQAKLYQRLTTPVAKPKP
jgi:arylsulfatase A-like enzyme